jgi:hypothetical protein
VRHYLLLAKETQPIQYRQTGVSAVVNLPALHEFGGGARMSLLHTSSVSNSKCQRVLTIREQITFRPPHGYVYAAVYVARKDLIPARIPSTSILMP